MVATHLDSGPGAELTLFGSKSSLRVYQHGGHGIFVASADLPGKNTRRKKKCQNNGGNPSRSIPSYFSLPKM